MHLTRQHFHNALRGVEEHIAMVFHRFMAEQQSSLDMVQWSEGQAMGPFSSRTKPLHSDCQPRYWGIPATHWLSHPMYSHTIPGSPVRNTEKQVVQLGGTLSRASMSIGTDGSFWQVIGLGWDS